MSVDLPAPLPPTRPMTSPGYRSTVTSSTAWTPPNATRMLRISTSGSAPLSHGFAAATWDGDGAGGGATASVGRRGLVHAHQILPAAQLCRRRRAASMPTAATSTTPTTMSWIGESTRSSTMPDCSDCMTTAPRTAPGMVPMPPANDVPPMTAAAMTSARPVPEAGDGGVQAGGEDGGADRRTACP